MCTKNYNQYTYQKPPYKNMGIRIQKEGYKCCGCPYYRPKMPLTQSAQGKGMIQEQPQFAQTVNLAMAQKITAGNTESTPKANLIMDTAINIKSDPADRQPPPEEAILINAQNVVADSTNIDTATSLDDAQHTEAINSSASLPLASESMPLPECFEHNTHVMPPEETQLASPFTDEVDTKSSNQAGHCSLLHYRKWWERTEVEISVFGKLITGIPIFIEEDTLRVINNNYSYFIPLCKVDYIRTTDGLHSCFDSSDDKATKNHI